jgi:hypothetical protein
MDVNQQDETQEKKSLNLKWVLPLFIRPRRTTNEIVTQEKSVWLTPLLILSILAVLYALIAAPVRRANIEIGANLPADFQYYTEEMQNQFYAAQEKQTSPLFLYVFPVLSGLLRFWVSWFILGILLYLSLTLAGSRAGSIKSYNLSAWSFLPFGVRYLVQILALLFSRTLVQNPGLSGFVSTDASGFISYLGQLLGFVDIYFIFQVILLLLGVIPLSGLSRGKAWTATAVSLLILVLLQAVPGFLSHALSGLSLNGYYFF